MATRPEIFISATTGDLASCRVLVRDELLTLGCMPIVEEHFGTTAGEIRQILLRKIRDCQAMIHLAGMRCGTIPQQIDSTRPRSYTQLEYDVARELGKPIYTFILAEGFSYDACEPEPETKCALQAQHRANLAAGGGMYHLVGTREELAQKVRALQANLSYLRDQLDEAQAQAAKRAEVAEAQNALLLERMAAMQARLDEHSRTGDLVLETVRRLDGTMAGVGRGVDALREAQAAVARENGVDEAELQARLATEGTDLRALLAEITEHTAAAEVQVQGWHRLQCEALVKLGNGEYAAGHYTAAENLYRQALDVQERTLAEDHPEALHSVNNLAVLLTEKGDLAGAEPLYRRALAAYERALGKEHPETLGCVNNLAILLRRKGDYAEAGQLYRRVLDVRERTLGPEHPDTLGSVNNLAILLKREGAQAEAERLYRQVLAARERTLGREHPDTLGSVNNLANLLAERGAYMEAEPLYRRALAACERTLSREHPDTLNIIKNLANVLSAQGNAAGAEPLYQRALDALKRTLGAGHPLTAETAFNFALLRSQRGELLEAAALIKPAVASVRASLPADHPQRLAYERLLRQLLDATGGGAAVLG